MSDLANSIMQGIHHTNVYEGFDATTMPDDLTGGEDHPVFEEAIKNLEPRFVVEVGSWKGKSAVHIAKLLKQYGQKECALLCVDTWLGSDPVHQWRFKDDPIWGMRDMYNHGFPQIYYQFLANVIRAGQQDIIIPFPNTSTVGAEWLKGCINITADIIYIDACHDEDECYLDIKRYWPSLTPGGVMIGDDFEAGWYGVICAVNRFAKEEGLQLMRTEIGSKWLLQKTA